ncbi:MAG: cellulase family glycosylhydrolase, partial [Thermoflexales bacterium]
MSVARPFLYLVTAALLAACARSPTPAPGSANGFCRLAVAGSQVVLATGQPLTLHGVSLPTLTEMARAGEAPIARVQALASAGARLVSLAIDDSELTPLYFPEKLAPVLQAANDAGIIVILSYRIRLQTANRSASNAEIDKAEDFLKLALEYVNSAPGIWFDPILEINEVPPVRRRNVAQRMVDIVRGYRADNIMLIRQPAWFRESNPGLSAPLLGGNIVYALSSAETAAGLPPAQVPFLLITTL